MLPGQIDWTKYVKFGITVILASIAITTYVQSGIDAKVDGKILKHEVEFEQKQRHDVTTIKTDIATLKAQNNSQQRQLDAIQEQGKHTQDLVEQLIRER